MIQTAYEMLRATDLEAHRRKALARARLTPVEDDRTVDAYVNQGRWVADCPNCNGGIACAPGEAGCCFSCGHIYTVTFPGDIGEAEQVLDQRPVANRNWRPDRGETLTDLKGDNLKRGVRI